MNSPKVSVIVAAYNAEKYLERCLNSIAGQTLKDWECIVVDDGSLDRTGTIADTFAERDTRFQVIHKENDGVGAARQAGIDRAVAKYSIHVDSDDWVDSNMLEELFSCAEEESADMVICDYWEIYPDHIGYNKQSPSSNDHMSVFGQTMNTLSGSLCNKLIRHRLYSQYNISFNRKTNFEEDKLVCLMLLSKPLSVFYLNKGFYHYDHTQNNSSTSVTGYSPRARLSILEQINNYCDITPVQSYFDQAVFYIAYQSLFQPKTLCPDYVGLFRPYLPSIRRARGFPLRSKWLVLLRMSHIQLPLRHIKNLIRMLKS